jgi:hypothetical protein
MGATPVGAPRSARRCRRSPRCCPRAWSTRC